MSVNTVTHLNFRGNARQALAFYQAVFGGNMMIMSYGDFGAPKESQAADQVVWGQVVADNGFRVMAYDVPAFEEGAAPIEYATYRENGMTITQAPFFISLRGDEVSEIAGLWDKLAENATIIEPLAASPWAPLFGMLTDRFGVTWVVDVAALYSPA